MIYLNNQSIIPTMFPDKTSQVWKLPEQLVRTTTNNIRWTFEHEGEFMQLAQLVSLIDHLQPLSRICLELTYLPYGRQDKPVNNELTFALTPFARLINGLNFDQVDILDPHSEIATELIDRSRAVFPTTQVVRRFSEMSADLVCYPDKGALTKYAGIYGYPYVYGEKDRNQSTGHIRSYQVVGEVAGQRILIVDDICDGGATFILLTKALLEKGATEVNLFVTHGIFSKGVQVLKDAGITRVFTAEGEY